MRPAHTPYDGSARPFTIGLKPLDPARWIEIDDAFDFQLREKRRIHAAHAADVFVAEDGTGAAQREVLDLLLEHLPKHFPDRYRRACRGIFVAGHPALGFSALAAMPALKAASLLVQEDLVLMRKRDNAWHLVVGSVCFPSSWTLTEKFGRPLHEIHEPVPGFGPATRTAGMIERIFDNLAVALPVERSNWSIQSGGALYHPLSSARRVGRSAGRASEFPAGDAAAHSFIRVERQTLRRLPVSGDILFTIRIHLDPVSSLGRHPDGPRLAALFAAQLAALDTDQLGYKGLAADRDGLVEVLGAIASGA